MILDLFKNKDVRNRLIFTVIILVIFRLGCAVPVPFTDSDVIDSLFGFDSLFDYADTLTGGALSQCSIFALGITPFINASIVIQLLSIAFDRLKSLQSGDETDRQLYDKIVKLTGLGFSFITAITYYVVLRQYSAVTNRGAIPAVLICAAFIFGSVACYWLSTLIDEIGIGSGMSLLIFAGIITRLSNVPSFVTELVSADWLSIVLGIILILFIAASIIYICYMSGSEIKIPVVYANVSRGANSSLPIKIMFSGVLPVIFATTLLSIPPTIGLLINNNALANFGNDSWIYIGIFAVLVFVMNAYYMSSQLNPDELAQNLKKNNAVIPGIRTGKPTSDYIKKRIYSIIPCSALAICLIAVIPMIIGKYSDFSVSLSGTSLIIICSVAIEVISRISAKMAEYKYYEGDGIWEHLK